MRDRIYKYVLRRHNKIFFGLIPKASTMQWVMNNLFFEIGRYEIIFN